MNYLIKGTVLVALLITCVNRVVARGDLTLSNTVTINILNFHVSGDGSSDDYLAIQNAINSAKNYSASTVKIIYFPSGTYRITKAISTATVSTVFKFASGSKLLLSYNTTGGILINHNSCEVDNATIIGNGVSAPTIYTGYGIMLQGVSNCRVSGCSFDNISGCNVFLIRSRGNGCVNNIIVGNKITHPAISIGKATDGAGILLGYSGSGYFHKNNTIENNIIDGAEILDNGIAIMAHANHNTISGNTVKNCLSYGILAYETKTEDSTLTSTYVLNNTVENIGAKTGTTTRKGMGIYLMKSHNSIVKGNTVINTIVNSDQSETLARGAISISGSADCHIENNVINTSGMYGIVNAYGFNNIFLNNRISNTSKAGMYLINTNNNIIKNNQFKNINGDVIIKGKFGNTKRKDFASNILLKRFRGINTGNKLTITDNIFYTNSRNTMILNFDNFPDIKANNIVNYKNNMGDNTINGNQISGNNKFIKTFIIPQNKSNSNRIYNNISK